MKSCTTAYNTANNDAGIAEVIKSLAQWFCSLAICL